VFQKEAADRAAPRRTGAAFPEGFGPLFVKPPGGRTPPEAAAFSFISAALFPDAEKQGEPEPQEDKAGKDKDK
jgi:hypothetical protein